MGTSKSPHERSRLRVHRATPEEYSCCVERTWRGGSLTFQDLQGFLIAFDGPGRAIHCGMRISRQVGTGTLVGHRHRVETSSRSSLREGACVHENSRLK